MRSRLLALLALSFLAASCSPKEERFESVCQLVHREVVEVDDQGAPKVVDYELEWDPCPGDQFQVVRGDATFAKCMEKYDTGELVHVKVAHLWDTRGFYHWDLYEVGDCAREMESQEGSFEKSQECSGISAYGANVGFECKRRPEAKLLQVCPWTARN
ncbi:hypothetical protein BH09MYX1_BH09MYX1_48700 [soil metagenome]